MKPWYIPDDKFCIAVAIIGGFFIAYIHNPNDDVMKGALIAAFAGAWGYFLGSSSGAKDANRRADKALDVATNAQEGK